MFKQTRQEFWRQFKMLKLPARIGLVCAFLVALLFVCIFTATMQGIAIATVFPVKATPVAQNTTANTSSSITQPTQVAHVVVKATPTSQVVRATPTSMPTTKPTATPTIAPTDTPIPTDTPQPVATAIPTSAPTQVPTVAPTQPPAPTGVNGNPWGYNFVPGNAIYSPPATFCNYFACINNFWNGRGYVEECVDGDYSLSGGIRGVCSYHGGAAQELFSH